MSLWRRIQRIGMKAAKFQFTVSLEELSITFEKGYCPKGVMIVFTRRGRRCTSQVCGHYVPFCSYPFVNYANGTASFLLNFWLLMCVWDVGLFNSINMCGTLFFLFLFQPITLHNSSEDASFSYTWALPDNLEVITTLYRNEKDISFEDKEWTFQIEDVSPIHTRLIDCIF